MDPVYTSPLPVSKSLLSFLHISHFFHPMDSDGKLIMFCGSLHEEDPVLAKHLMEDSKEATKHEFPKSISPQQPVSHHASKLVTP